MFKTSLDLASCLAAFAPLFSKRVWCHVPVLAAGAILAPGKRTVTSVLRIMGLEDESHFQNYHRVLNRAVWSNLRAGGLLLNLLVAAFAPSGPLILGLDDTPSSGAGGPRSRRVASIATRCGPRGALWSRPAACAG